MALEKHVPGISRSYFSGFTMDSPWIHHGFTRDSPWIHPVAQADDMAFAWATAKTNSLTGCF